MSMDVYRKNHAPMPVKQTVREWFWYKFENHFVDGTLWILHKVVMVVEIVVEGAVSIVLFLLLAALTGVLAHMLYSLLQGE